MTDAEYLEGLRKDAAAGKDYYELLMCVSGPNAHPTRNTKGWVTREVWDSPVFQEAYRIVEEVGVRQGKLAPSDGRTGLLDFLGAPNDG